MLVYTCKRQQELKATLARNSRGEGLDGLINRGQMLDVSIGYLHFDSQVIDLMEELQEKIKEEEEEKNEQQNEEE